MSRSAICVRGSVGKKLFLYFQYSSSRKICNEAAAHKAASCIGLVLKKGKKFKRETKAIQYTRCRNNKQARLPPRNWIRFQILEFYNRLFFSCYIRGYICIIIYIYICIFDIYVTHTFLFLRDSMLDRFFSHIFALSFIPYAGFFVLFTYKVIEYVWLVLRKRKNTRKRTLRFKNF